MMKEKETGGFALSDPVMLLMVTSRCQYLLQSLKHFMKKKDGLLTLLDANSAAFKDVLDWLIADNEDATEYLMSAEAGFHLSPSSSLAVDGRFNEWQAAWASCLSQATSNYSKGKKSVSETLMNVKLIPDPNSIFGCPQKRQAGDQQLVKEEGTTSKGGGKPAKASEEDDNDVPSFAAIYRLNEMTSDSTSNDFHIGNVLHIQKHIEMSLLRKTVCLVCAPVHFVFRLLFSFGCLC